MMNLVEVVPMWVPICPDCGWRGEPQRVIDAAEADADSHACRPQDLGTEFDV